MWGAPCFSNRGPNAKFVFVFSIRLAGAVTGTEPPGRRSRWHRSLMDQPSRSSRIARKAFKARHAEAIKLTCISQNFNDRRARAAHSD
jgi:hypothetical protein